MPRLSIPRIDRFHSFPGQRSGEEAVIFARHHWIFDLGVLLRCVFWLAVPLTVPYLLVLLRVDMSARTRAGIVILLCWIEMIILVAHFIQWLKMYLDYVVISTERIVDVEQLDLFRVSVSETSLADIQDVTSTVTSFFGSMMGYGNLRIQTAAEKSEFSMRGIPRAMEIRPMILDLAEAFRSHHGTPLRHTIVQDPPPGGEKGA